MTPLVEVAAGCVLLYVGSEFEPIDTGWVEQTRVELGASDADCDFVRLPLESGVQLEDGAKLSIKQGDGIRRNLGAQSVQLGQRTLRDSGEAVVHLPDMLGGDRAVLTFERTWTRDAALDWHPLGARHADLSAPGATVEMLGRAKAGKRGAWVGDAVAGDGVRLSTTALSGTWTGPDAGLLPPSVEPVARRQLTLVVPPGDPQILLHPGGGSRLNTQLHLSFEAEERDRSVLIPTGPGRSDVKIASQPSDATTWRERPDGIVLTVLSSEGPARVTVVWTQDDAPTHGGPGDDDDLVVDVPDGKLIVDTNGDWFVAGLGNRAIIPSRKHLVKALERRWRNAAIPEPGLPNELRGMEVGWDFAAALPEALNTRVEVVDWGADPLFPRRLNKARKTGGLTPTEAGITTWLYALQSQLEAEWALIRPAPSGPAGDASPHGYTDVLVRVRIDGEERWLDPACQVCAPFEVRPEMTGASALGRDLREGPPIVPGRWTVVVDPEWVRWELTGPPAIELRRWLQRVPIAERYDALAARMAGPGAELVEVEGLDALGAPIQLAARGGTGIRANPMDLPPAEARFGTTWVDWIGTRELIGPGQDAQPAHFRGEALGFSREVSEDGITTEKLVLGQRLLIDADLAGFATARTPPPPVEEGDVDGEGTSEDGETKAPAGEATPSDDPEARAPDEDSAG